MLTMEYCEIHMMMIIL